MQYDYDEVIEYNFLDYLLDKDLAGFTLEEWNNDYSGRYLKYVGGPLKQMYYKSYLQYCKDNNYIAERLY